MKRAWRVRLFSLASFACNLALWSYCLRRPWTPVAVAIALVGGVALVYPVSALGRLALDDDPSKKRIGFKIAAVHAVLMAALGTSAVAAVRLAMVEPGWGLQLSIWFRGGLLALSALLLAQTVVVLACGGLGAPFAVLLSRRLARNYFYAWTRNPMVLAVIAFGAAAGLFLGSLWFVLWTAAWVFPAWWFFLKHFEERELEIRFGKKYRAYRERTPMFWPAKPRGGPR